MDRLQPGVGRASRADLQDPSGRDGAHEPVQNVHACGELRHRCAADVVPRRQTDRFLARLRSPPPQDPGEAGLIVMRADGTGVRKVTDHDRPIAYGDFGPQWSPNGNRLVFNRLNRKRGLWAVMTINLDGTGT